MNHQVSSKFGGTVVIGGTNFDANNGKKRAPLSRFSPHSTGVCLGDLFSFLARFKKPLFGCAEIWLHKRYVQCANSRCICHICVYIYISVAYIPYITCACAFLSDTSYLPIYPPKTSSSDRTSVRVSSQSRFIAVLTAFTFIVHHH